MTEAVMEAKKEKTKFMDDPLFSVIVPIYDIPPMTLKRCLMSLADQDYQNKEVIMVLDGPNKELEKIAEAFVDQYGFNLFEIEHGGACAARNFGFEKSKGEIVSFFNSDYIAKPGMIRMWVDKLQANPDCGFVYGGYEYNSAQRSWFESGSYDPFLLNTENYIDCGFPLWRKYVVAWDTDCKSLQDWDFWLRVVKTHGVRGHYLGREFSFIAEIPRPKGLSFDSRDNWNQRVDYVKKKNGIDQRDVLVTSLGAENHAVEIAKMIGADYRRHTWHKTDWIDTYKALYMIGFYIKPNEAGLNEHARRLAIFKDKNPNAKRIVHFVGADIYWLRKFPYDSLKYLSGALKQSCDSILSENQQAHDELLAFGIPSEIVPIPSYTPSWEVKPLPKEFKVSLFLVDGGQSDFDKYCYEQTLSIVRAMPDIQFTAYGAAGHEIRYYNLRHYKTIPREKWPDYVYENSALLRLVRHDTLPMAGCEFLMAGRDVITNIAMKHAHVIDTSGHSELNEWDKFGEGFNAYNWPATKKKIIQKIREIKNFDTNGPLDHLTVLRKPWSDDYKVLLDRTAYIMKIRELCNVGA